MPPLPVIENPVVTLRLDVTINKKIDQAIDILRQLNLGHPLHLFELQLRRAKEKGRKSAAYIGVRDYVKSEDFGDTMSSILGHSILADRLRGLAAREGGKLLDEVFSEQLCNEMEAEVGKLSGMLSRKVDTITPESLLSFDFEELEGMCRETAPRLWRVLGRVTNFKKDAKLKAKVEEMEDEIEDESSEEEDVQRAENTKGKTKKKKIRKNRGMMMTVITSLVCYTRTNRANLLQGVVGYCLMAQQVPKRAMALLARLGICVTYESVTKVVKNISACLKYEYRNLVHLRLCVWVWDNLNQMYRIKKRMLSHQDHLSNETQPFLIFIDEKASKIEGLLGEENIHRERALDMTPEELIPDYEQLRHTSKVHVFNILYRFFKKTGMGDAVREDGRPTIKPIYPLSLLQSQLYPLPTFRLNEARIDETLSVIDAIEREIGMDGEEFAEKKICQFCGGDFVTCRNTNRALYQRTECHRKADSKSYLEPTIGLFHFTMATQQLISNCHWGRGDGKDVASIDKFQTMFGDNKVDKQCKDFRRTEYFHNDLLDSHVIAMCMAALGFTTTEELGTWLGQKESNWQDMINQLVDHLFDPLVMQQRRYDPETGEKRAGGLPARPTEWGPPAAIPDPAQIVRDVTLENAMLFTRDMLVYRELTSSCKQGDPGRLIHVIKYFTVLFQGTRQFNYARETVHLITCLERIWDEKAKKVWMHSVLINPSGLPNRWVPKDLYNEWLIRDGKDMVRPWTNQLFDQYNKEHLVRQLQVMKNVKKMMMKQSGATDYKDKSQVVDSKETVDIMVRELVKEKVFTQSETPRERCRGLDNSLLKENRDLLFDGLAKIASGETLSTYFSTARCNWSGDASAFTGGVEDDDDQDWEL